jgi:nucleoside-diphosphate-sugar epimerase
MTGLDGALGAASCERLRGAGHRLTDSAAEADAVLLLDLPGGGTLTELADRLVGRAAAALEAARGAKRVVIAAPAEAYGEGPGQCASCGRVRIETWAGAVEPVCPRCDGGVAPEAAREDDRLLPMSPEAALAAGREQFAHAWGRARGVEVVSLRFFEIVSPGVPPHAAGEIRDYVALEEAAAAPRAALEHPGAAWEIFNVGSGKAARAAGGAAGTPSPRRLFADPKKLHFTLGLRLAPALPAALL